MYEQFATVSELGSYLDCLEADLPTDANRMLKRVSDQVYSLIKMNYISTNANHVAAVKMATCAQVEYYINAGETSAIVGGITSVGSGKTSISLDPTATMRKLCNRSIMYLNDFGLLYRGIGILYIEQQEV